MAGVSAFIPGLQRMMKQLRDMPRDVENARPITYRSVISQTTRDAKSRAPHLTGKLADSIQSDKDSDGPFLYSDVPYAVVNEFGGEHPVWGRDPMVSVTPQPFMTPAIEEHLSDFMEANKDAVLRAARKAGFR